MDLVDGGNRSNLCSCHAFISRLGSYEEGVESGCAPEKGAIPIKEVTLRWGAPMSEQQPQSSFLVFDF